MTTVAILATMDTKAAEVEHLASAVSELGGVPYLVDIGVVDAQAVGGGQLGVQQQPAQNLRHGEVIQGGFGLSARPDVFPCCLFLVSGLFTRISP